MQNMADDKNNAAKDSDILQHLPEAHLQHKMATKYGIKTCGSERDKSQWQSRFYGGSGAGLNTPSGSARSQHHTSSPDLVLMQGKRKRGRPYYSWKRDTEAEMMEQRIKWSGAQNQVR
jgi:hypothetical protein